GELTVPETLDIRRPEICLCAVPFVLLRAQAERIRKRGRVVARILIQVDAARNPDRVFRQEPPRLLVVIAVAIEAQLRRLRGLRAAIRERVGPVNRTAETAALRAIELRNTQHI